MNKGIVTLIGFLIFLFGMLSLILAIVGLKLVFLKWIDAGGATLGFVIKILMIFGGIVTMYLAHNSDEEE